MVFLAYHQLHSNKKLNISFFYTFRQINELNILWIQQHLNFVLFYVLTNIIILIHFNLNLNINEQESLINLFCGRQIMLNDWRFGWLLVSYGFNIFILFINDVFLMISLFFRVILHRVNMTWSFNVMS